MDQQLIGERIAAGRKAKGLTQAELAAFLFVSKQAVGKWERGESLPDIIMLKKIADAIGITHLNYFLNKHKQECKCAVCCCCGNCGC
jgi:transcriptional regulator with XRE-family HTH domain